MRFLILLFLIVVFIAFVVVLVKYLLLKEKSKQLKQKLEKQSSQNVEVVNLSKRDKINLFNVFGKKLSYKSLISKVIQYEITFNKNEFFIGGINDKYDIIKLNIRKIRLNGQSLFSIDVMAWSDKEDYLSDYKPSKEILETLIKEETLNEQTLIVMNKFFSNKNKIKTATITIDND